MSLADDLRAARDYMLVHGWYQGDYTGPGGSVCILGACNAAIPVRNPNCDDAQAAVSALHRLIPGQIPVSFYNDDPDRTEDEVFDLFDAAIKAAEES